MIDGMWIATWFLALSLLVWTLAMLPFINLDMSLRLQFWLRDMLRKVRDLQDRADAQQRDEELGRDVDRDE